MALRRHHRSKKATRSRQAAKWEDVATAELAEEEGDDPEDFDWKKGDFRNSIRVEQGRMEWLVFEDYDDAENACSDYVSDLVEDDPESYAGDLLQHYVMMDDTTREIIASEEADAYLEDVQDDSEIDRLEDWTDTSDYVDLVDRLEELESEIDDQTEVVADIQSDLDDLADEDDDDSLAEATKLESQLESEQEALEELEAEEKELEGSKEGAFDELKEAAAEGYANEIEGRIKSDLMGWLDDLGYDLAKEIPSFLSIDWSGLVEALMQDGVESWFAGYDGNQMDLDSGAVAYRQN